MTFITLSSPGVAMLLKNSNTVTLSNTNHPPQKGVFAG